MLSIGVVNDPKEINDIVGQIDKDSNGMIDFEEFVDFLTPHMKQKNGGSQDRHELMFRQLTEKMEVSPLAELPLRIISDHPFSSVCVAPKRGVSGDQHAALDGAEAVHFGLHHEAVGPVHPGRFGRNLSRSKIQ